MREKLNSLYTLVESACDGCPYSYMSGDCTVDGCSINEAFWMIKDFLEENMYDKD